jgi:hypothetical protein
MLSVHAAIARQDPPPKSAVVVIFGALAPAAQDGTSIDWAHCPHLDAAALDGSTGLLAFADAPGASEAEQVLGAAAAGPSPPPPLGARFKGLRAALLADCPAVCASAAAAGYAEVAALPGGGVANWPKASEVARRVAAALGEPRRPAGAGRTTRVLVSFPEWDARLMHASMHAADVKAFSAANGDAADAALDASAAAAARDAADDDDGAADMALVLLHACPPHDALAEAQAADGEAELAAACGALHWADALVRHLDGAPGFRETVLLSVVLAPGRSPLPGEELPQEQAVLQPALPPGGPPFPRILRPTQSYQFSGAQRVRVRAARPALVVHRLCGVIR